MSTQPQQLAPAHNWRRALIAAVVSMAVTTAALYLPYGKWTLILAVGLLVFLWFFSREFGLWCQSMSATALAAVTVLNLVPSGGFFATWGEADFGAVIEGRHWSVDVTLVLASLGFGGLAYLFRKPSALGRPVSLKNVVSKPSAPNSPGVVMGDVTYNQPGARLQDATVNDIIQHQLKANAEKAERLVSLESQLSEKDDLIEKFKEGLARAEKEAQKGQAAARAAIDDLRKSGDTEKLQKVLEAEADQSKTDFIERCLEISAIAFLRGDIETAKARAQAVLALDSDESRALNQLGHIERLLGNLDAAELAYQRVLDAGERSGSSGLVAVGASNLGLIYEARGDLDQAQQMLRKSLKINEMLGRFEGMAANYGNLGVIHGIRGDPNQAEEMFRRALEIDEKLGQLEGMASCYGNLGLIYKARGDLDQAEEMHRKSLKIEKQLGRLEGMASEYGNLGLVCKARGDLDQAEKFHRKSLKISQKLGRREGMASAYANLGTVYNFRGDVETARRYLNKARDLYAQIGMPHMVQKLQSWLDDLPPADPSDS